MEIKEEDFILAQLGTSSHWDVYLLRSKKSGDDYVAEAYGVSLESALKHIIHYRMQKKKDVLTLKEYLTEFKNQITNLKNLID